MKTASMRFAGAFWRYLYVPVMIVGLGGLAVALAASPAPATLVVSPALLAIAASFLAERRLPYQREWNRDRGETRRDVVHALVNESLTVGAVAALAPLGGVLAVWEVWPAELPLLMEIVLALVVLDVGITLAHRASHLWGWLWRFHAVHHSVTRSYGFNGLMKHPLHQLIETAAGTTPLVLIGLPQRVGLTLAVLVVIQLLLQHSNVDYRVGPLRRWLALNQAHRLHHLRYAGEGDVNFGLFLLAWDRLLGTYSAPETRVVEQGDLGLVGRTHFPTGYLAQLGEPFRVRSAAA